MLLDPRTPVIVGSLLVALLVGVLAFYSPMPGDLSSAHAQIEGISTVTNCDSCHDEAGMDQGCLGCHSEIRQQLVETRGYHSFLMRNGEKRCADCHSEHFGGAFHMVNERSWGAQVPAAFSHPHVDFRLEGKHDRLRCGKCHEEKRVGRTFLDNFEKFEREHSFLGISQNCEDCHEDVHAGGLASHCGNCHAQESFAPAGYFDHDSRFPITGAHTGLDCKECHVFERPAEKRIAETKSLPYPFDSPRAKRCVGCHESPHLAAFGESCDDCHVVANGHWTRATENMTPAKHVATGFRLLGAHANIDCAKCHPPELSFRERHPDPSTPGYARLEDSCHGCHAEPHGGQFAGRYERCLDCHTRDRFNPSAFGFAAHARNFALTGAHAAVACSGCHLLDESTHVRRFVGTSHSCKVCHADPHAGQFREQIESGDCNTCHDSDARSFRIRPFDHLAETGYALKGAHSRADCRDCHVEVAMGGVSARRFKETPQTCHSCHKDVHKGQFQSEQGFTTCTGCHTSLSTWHEVAFDHNTQSRFPLEGKHAELDCSRCHVRVRLEDGNETVRYKPLGTKCRDCHDVVPYKAR